MAEAHAFIGSAAIAAPLVIVGAAVWSVVAARRSAGRVDHRFAVDRAVLAELLLLAGAGLVGTALLLGGSEPADPLHLVYGPAAILCVPLAIVIGGRGSPGHASRQQRDMWTAGGAIVLLGLGLRLVATG